MQSDLEGLVEADAACVNGRAALCFGPINPQIVEAFRRSGGNLNGQQALGLPGTDYCSYEWSESSDPSDAPPSKVHFCLDPKDHHPSIDIVTQEDVFSDLVSVLLNGPPAMGDLTIYPAESPAHEQLIRDLSAWRTATLATWNANGPQILDQVATIRGSLKEGVALWKYNGPLHPDLLELATREFAWLYVSFVEAGDLPSGGDGPNPQEKLSKGNSSDPSWPEKPNEIAFRGLAGEFVRMVEPFSEADPTALLIQLLTAFGSVIGRGPHFIAEQTKHCSNLFVVIVGRTSKARKGSSWSQVFQVLHACDPIWAKNCVISGLVSGEGMIWQVRDPIYKKERVKDKGGQTRTEEVCVDDGVKDKRRLALEAEFASLLQVMGREGNTLSPVVRKAWETGNLESLAKNSPAKATGAHYSIVAHIVKDEVCRDLNRTERGNGFANRFLWVCATRSKAIADDIPDDAINWAPFITRLKSVIESARGTGRIRRDEGAQDIWRRVYPHLSEGVPGMLGAVLNRAESQVMRLACLYALLDGDSAIRADHLRAALALWEYSEASARFIFGDTMGDPVVDEILQALRMHPDGLTRTQISDLFGRHRHRDQLSRALSILLEHGLARVKTEKTAGRPIERWYAF